MTRETPNPAVTAPADADSGADTPARASQSSIGHEQAGMPAPRSPRRRLWRLLAALQAVLIFGLSSIPGSRYPRVNLPGLDKLAHLVLYALLAWLLLQAFWPGGPRPAAGETAGARRATRLGVLAALVLTLLWGAGDELHQQFVPGRSMSGWDLVADGVGALTGLAVWRLTSRRRIRGCGAADAG